MKRNIFFFLSVAVTAYYDENPIFNTTPEHIIATEGDKVVLKCNAQNLGKYQVVLLEIDCIIDCIPCFKTDKYLFLLGYGFQQREKMVS